MDLNIIFLIVNFIAFFLALSAHEFSHALAAYQLGDRTAQYAGRLTLNPLAHIDLIGTVLLPLFLILSNVGIVFGWAKPVPVNYFNLKDQKWGPAIVSLAGPLANFIFGIFSLIVFVLVSQYGRLGSDNLLLLFLQFLAMINFVLMIFNLIPIPPLDGSKILYALLPDKYDNVKMFLEQFGLIILLLFLFIGVGFIFAISQAIFIFFLQIIQSFI